MINRFLKLNSLRSRLMLVVALALVPSVLLTTYSGWKEREHAIQTAEENLQRLTNLAALNEAESIRNARQLLVDLSGIPDLLGSPRECSALLKTILKKNPDYANLGLIQLNGDVTCSAIPVDQPVNLHDRSHFKMAIEQRRFIAGSYVFGRVIRKHTINLTYPVFHENGDVAAVVFAALDLAELDNFTEGISLPRGSVLITSDNDGNVISRRPAPEQWLGTKIDRPIWDSISRAQRTPEVLTGPDGIARLHAFARIGTPDLSNYTVTIGIPSDEIIASARRDQVMALLTLAVLTLLALLATWFVGNVMIVSRVEKLVDTASRIAAGDLDARTGLQYGREEISYLARTLDDMAQALQRRKAERDRAEEELRVADRRKDEFLAMLAHELRNPLAPIRTATDILKLIATGEPRVRQTSDIIGRQVEHMTGLVNDLLDVSRVTRGLVKLVKEPLDLRSVVVGAVEQARALIDEHGHRLDIDMPDETAWVCGDRMRLMQVITNLLNNAAKYTPHGGQIRLWMMATPREWIVGVKDSGVGISAELLPHVFELFSQAERTPDRSQGGLGLGLALVKSLVELHDGTVVAHSAGIGLGSEFSFGLPRLHNAILPLPECVSTPAATDAAAPLHLLVVDDNVDAADMVAALLRTFGYTVSTAYDARTALHLAEQEAPQALLLDIGLPDMDGYALARRLRQLPQTAQATLIALTGYGQAEDRERSSSAGFDHHLVKPADPATLAQLLAEVSSQR